MERIFDSDDIYFVDDRGRFLVFIRQDGEPSPVFYFMCLLSFREPSPVF